VNDGWLLLIHQLPPKPAYIRVKISRRLQKIGAVQLKSTVYVLPMREEQMEDLQWVRKEIVADGGEATVCEARFLDGHSDADVVALFHAARAPEWDELVGDLRDAVNDKSVVDASRLRARYGELVKRDFFPGNNQARAHTLLEKLEKRARKEAGENSMKSQASYRRRTWVTRERMKVDRLACAWLVRRFVDPDGELKLVPAKGYHPKAKEVLFDMFDVPSSGNVEFELITHEGDKCSFEVLLERAHVDDKGLRAIAEIVHDVDLKDAKYGRPETAGVAAMIDAIALHDSDDERLKRATTMFDDLHALLSKGA
jgi:hypothetical protein